MHFECAACCQLHSVAVKVKRPLKKYGFSFSSFMRQIPYLRRGVLPWDRRLFPFWKNLFNFVYVFKNQSFDFLSVIDKNSVKSIRDSCLNHSRFLLFKNYSIKAGKYFRWTITDHQDGKFWRHSHFDERVSSVCQVRSASTMPHTMYLPNYTYLSILFGTYITYMILEPLSHHCNCEKWTHGRPILAIWLH